MAQDAPGGVVLHVPLHSQFRYVHEPLPMGDRAIPVLGHEALVGALKERLTYSHGGAFLVTGFRGVGKSTLVLRALAEASVEWGSADVLLVAHLNVARSMTTDQLLFAIVRRIFEALDDRSLLARLPRDVQRSLLLAYTRTSLSFTQTQSESRERGTTLGLAPKHGLTPTMNFQGRRTRSQATEAAFLAYSETDVEHDLVRIIHLLNGSEGRLEPQPPPSRGLFGRRRLSSGARFRVHPVVVLDEVDKLTDNQEAAIAELESLLGRLKNVLTARGAHFIVVAGPDLHDQAIRDVDRGNGVYESVFGWRMYVPCLWEAPQRLVHGLTHVDERRWPPPPLWPPHPTQPPRPDGTTDLNGFPAAPPPFPEDWQLDQFTGYLRFKARGVPRRLLQEFNTLVHWESGKPSLLVRPEDWSRIEFYAQLEAIVAAAMGSDDADRPAAVAIDDDRRRLGGYHVVDWALRSEGRPFTSAEVTGTTGLDPLLRMTLPVVERLLRHLTQAGVLDVVSEPGRPDATRYGGRAETSLAYYKLSDAYKRQLAGFVRSSESERADLGIVAPPSGSGMFDTTLARARSVARPPAPVPGEEPSGPDDWPEPPSSDGTPAIGVLADRYEMRSLLGQGGMGSVYRGRNLLTGQEVAIKCLHRGLLDDEEMLARFRREAEVGQRLNHPHIARTLDALGGPDTEPALIMELIEGPSLRELLDTHGPLPTGLVARIGREIGEALDFVETMGVSRIDLKPSNVLLSPGRGAVIVDLGIARPSATDSTQVTVVGMVIGTPGYMAPEQITGTVTDIRADLYALGILMYECFSGRAPWSAESVPHLLYRILHEELPIDDLPVSARMRALIRRTVDRSPASRPQSPEEFLTDLAETPEAGAEVGPEALEEGEEEGPQPLSDWPDEDATTAIGDL
ncbi:protein kinase domain-containing protein [Wenjunlia tyrosinilytica]|uniref:non-specific serine/threonine protein kinase n=1 Tax=Wenjunlia tyrosinilytica TaxID=1544741 RepID=A0A917ZVX6_9ACTN|nr:protein kinase [Wenjunlia tyrosinilytica]GGO95880.1 hypothetical protein GCM10012280_54100 [Wenjunlia tyrosinilytica]